MSLTLDELHLVLDALRRDLLGARCNQARASADEPGAVVLELDTYPRQAAIHHLLAAASRGAARLHRVHARPPAPPEPGAFVMFLRKHVVGARLLAIEPLAGDRVAALDFVRGDEVTRLVVDLVGPQAALYALHADGTVATALGDSPRVGPGSPWRPPTAATPPPRGRRDGWPDDDPDAFVEAAYGHAMQRERAAARLRDVSAALRDAHRRTERRRAAIERDAAAVDASDDLRRDAELLTAALGTLDPAARGRGHDHLAVTDWFDPALAQRVVALDPKLDLLDNIDARFKRYRRMQRGQEVVLERLMQTEAACAALAALLERVAAFDVGDPAALHAALDDVEAQLRRIDPGRAARAQGQQPSAGRGKSAAARRLPYVPYRSRSGQPIWVGRGGRDNDSLTFGVARGNDLWLHTADWPGAHVIVPTRSGEPDDRTIRDAALLAAHFSRGRNDGVIGVLITHRKHVRKPKGAPPGTVSTAGVRTIELRIDAEALAALLATREGGEG